MFFVRNNCSVIVYVEPFYIITCTTSQRLAMKNIEELIKRNKEILEARKQMLRMLEVMEDNHLIKEEEGKIKLAELELKRLMKSE